MIDLRTEFEKLLEARDLAAYRAAAVVAVVVDFFEAQDYETAEKQLRSSLAEFREADRKVNQFIQQLKAKKNSQGEKRPAHGNRTDRQSTAS